MPRKQRIAKALGSKSIVVPESKKEKRNLEKHSNNKRFKNWTYD